jgi:hypothetical protein
MCHVSAGNQVPQMNTFCSCGYNCVLMIPIYEEIRRLEDHTREQNRDCLFIPKDAV